MSDDHDAGRPTEGLRERKKRLRRQALHDAALRLVEQNGLDGTTVEQICEDVGVSPRTFFNYFPSKSAAALNLRDQVVSPESAERFRNATGELMPAVCELLVDAMNAGAERARIKKLFETQPQIAEPLAQWMGKLKTEFSALIQERTASPETADAAITLALTSFRALLHEPTDEVTLTTARLLGTMDELLAARHAMLAEPNDATT
ncbi:TetR/AcrR family transcriptional regulator [Pseudoclavibacter chungangensis]|uniref:TetR/AcrR family transcriptional regulator n=1 Tax=Pseudoclavibacter chungangensis TaxID=587635 RepID=A0A7J5BZV9_9MICO|nr:TetR family transcriptional regulator [Pseudoclavibacter chungangensis]KAB1659695.1 TetR/AcrR family transcriptional regulator [Pseudoclavibacter chungangensis]NYJ67534.1 AcrR family transcriptional regulator [Pseudoclavibacter chungangensis]